MVTCISRNMLKNINAVREVAVADHREEEVGYQEVEVDEEGLGSALHGIWM